MVMTKLLSRMVPCERPCLLGPNDLKSICTWASVAANLPGDFLEIGSYNGSSTIAISDYVDVKTQKFHAVEAVKRDLLIQNIQKNRLEDVVNMHFMTQEKYFDSEHFDELQQISFVLLDHDHSLASTKLSMEMIWPKIVPGGIVLCHDYQHQNYMPATHYLDKEWPAGRPVKDCFYLIRKSQET